MSNLSSYFDTYRGWPESSALAANFKAATGVSLPAGTVVYVKGLQLPPVSVLRIKDDSLNTAPALLAADAGKAYMLHGNGGAWSGFAIGDIVEWDGAAWHRVVAHDAGLADDGTAVVVIESGAAGSFAGQEEKLANYSQDITIALKALGYTPAVAGDIGKPVVGSVSGDTGTLVSYDNGTKTWHVHPDTGADVFGLTDTLSITGGTGAGDVNTITPSSAWVNFVVPVDQNQIEVIGVGSIYVGDQVQYQGTHPAGAWVVLSTKQTAAPYVDKLTSSAQAADPNDCAWMVIEGNDQFDGSFTNSVTAVKLGTGLVIKLTSTIANTLAPGDKVQANAGVLEKYTNKQIVARVRETNNTAGSGGLIVIVA